MGSPGSCALSSIDLWSFEVLYKVFQPDLNATPNSMNSGETSDTSSNNHPGGEEILKNLSTEVAADERLRSAST